MNILIGKFFIKDTENFWEVLDQRTGQVYYFKAKRKYTEERKYKLYFKKNKIVKVKRVPTLKVSKKDIEKIMNDLDYRLNGVNL